MTQTAHTPGPWVASPHMGYWMIGAPVSEELPAHAERHIGNIYREGNARLIAAAPDLLETLEYVLLAADYDGALTLGTAALSPAIRDRIVRTLAKVHGEETAE